MGSAQTTTFRVMTARYRRPVELATPLPLSAKPSGLLGYLEYLWPQPDHVDLRSEALGHTLFHRHRDVIFGVHPIQGWVQNPLKSIVREQ